MEKEKSPRRKTAAPSPAQARAAAPRKNPERAARCLQALAHPARLCILNEIRAGEKTVSQLQAALGCTQANVSQHLRLMRDRGILLGRKVGSSVLYRVADPRILGILTAVEGVFCQHD